jgi:hypothetical protein
MSILARIADAAGETAATRIAAAFGGRRLYIPERLPADHPLCRLVGFDAARAIRRDLGCGHVDVPLARTPGEAETRRTIAALDDRGLNARAIAARLGCTMRTVYRHRAAIRRERT